MKYNSTRGGIKDATFEDTLFAGYASDGGLFLPQNIPKVDFMNWSGLCYKDVVFNVASMFIHHTEIPTEELRKIVDGVYSSVNFTHPDIASLRTLDPSVSILELFYGQTWAFKDYALQFVGALLEYFLQRRRQHLNILIATSGDTGSAAINAIKNKSNMDIYVLLPGHGRITEIQQRQMTTVLEDNVHVYSADANSDELDEVLAPIFKDDKFVKSHNVTSINSINWARIMVQIGHWIYGYLRCVPQESSDFKLEIAVPTGACGNITAGLIANRMGLPIKIIACTTSNYVVGTLINEGEMMDDTNVVQTMAPAMDIARPYNVERILYILSEGSFVPTTYSYSLPTTLLQKLQAVFKTFQADDVTILNTIKETYTQHNYLICPHTATAVTYALKNQSPTLCIATAGWYKFPGALEKAGVKMTRMEPPKSLANLMKMPTKQKYLERNEEKEWKMRWTDVIKQEIVDQTREKLKN